MLGSIFHKRKKPQDLRTPSLQDIKRFRDTYARHAERRSVEPPACLERSVYKAISSQRELHSLDFRQEDITDPQLIAMAETLAELPLISSLDLRDNRITDDGAKALLEVLRLQIIAAKTPVPCDPKTKKPLFPQVPDYTKYVTSVNLRGNEVSAEVQQELAQYTAILRREDKRLEIRAALAQIDRDSGGDIDEDEFKGVLKLLTGAEPSKRDLRAMLQQHSLASDSAQGALSLENVLLARCSSPTSNKAASPPWEALVQVRHAVLGPSNPSSDSGVDLLGKQAMDMTYGQRSSSARSAYSEVSAPPSPAHVRMPSPVASIRSPEHIESDAHERADSEVSVTTLLQSSPNVQMENTPASTPAATPTIKLPTAFSPPSSPAIPPLIFAPPSPDIRRGSVNSARSSSVAPDEDSVQSSTRGSLTKQLSGGQSRGVFQSDRAFTPSASSTSSPRQSEPLDSPRPNVSVLSISLPPKRIAPDNSEKAMTPTKSAFVMQDASGLDQDDFMHDFENSSEADIFGNDSSTDDILLSALAMSSASDSRKGEMTPNSNGLSSTTVTHTETGLDSDKGFASIHSLSLERVGKHDATEKNTPREDEFSPEGVKECQSDEFSHDNTNWFEERDGFDNDVAADLVAGSVVDQAVATTDAKLEITDDEDEEERVDVVDAEVIMDGKPRTVMKLTHTSFKTGLKLTEFPSEVPFRNLLVLILSDNRLRDLNLFEECRFPCLVVLDLSRNRLSKVPDKALAMFPKLQVLDMAHNQLKFISGVLESFKLRALNVSHNNLRSVTNIEHLVFLEVLQLSANSITTAQSLRLLSLNKMLTRIDLEGNPIVTDERQRRKNIAYILNLVPTLTSLGSIQCASLQSKEKKKKATAAVTDGASLFDASYFPEMETAWVKQICDLLGCFQDKPLESFRDRERDEDDTVDDDEGEGPTNNVKKPLNRAQQRQKDEMRSRAVSYRSREKAPPSPPKAKTTIYSFGAPLPPPSPKKTKKSANTQVDPAAVRRQLKRASELSAPRHPPVDTALLKQEQKRSSRSTFDTNMSVAERLLLAQELAQRRTSSMGVKRSSSSKRPGKRNSSLATASKDISVHATGVGVPANQQETGSVDPKPGSPRNFSPTKEVVAFRIEPLSSIRRQDVLEFRVEPSRQSPTHAQTPASKALVEQRTEGPSSPRTVAPPTKEGDFLRSLSVGDFLNHAAEELSTALTALNVLLSMCEKELSDRNKLSGYRASLEALGILNERESHELFEKTKAFGSHDQEGQCSEAFDRLGLVKRCMRQLLEKLHDHEPGSAVIRAFCRSMRSVELRSVLSDFGEPSPDARAQEHDAAAKHEMQVATTQPQPSPASITSRLFGSLGNESSPNLECGDPPLASHTDGSHAASARCDKDDAHELRGDIDLDFLDSTTSSFDTDSAAPATATVAGDQSFSDTTNGADSEELSAFENVVNQDSKLHEAASNFEAALLESSSAGLEDEAITSSYPVTSDITFDIQMGSGTAVFDADITESHDNFEELHSADAAESSHQGLATEEPLDGAGSDDDWLTGGMASETADVDVLEANLQADDTTASWDETREEFEPADDTFKGGDIDFEGDEAGANTTPSVTEPYDSQSEDTRQAADTVAWQEGDVPESNELPAGIEDEVQVEYHEVDEGDGLEPTVEFEEPAAAYEEPTAAYDESGASTFAETEDAYAETDGTYAEGEVTYAEGEVTYAEGEVTFAEGEATYAEGEADDTELAEDAQAAEQELGTGEDADDEAAEMFEDWEKGFDPSTNHYFWFNHATGESSWEPPEGWPYEVDEPFEAEGEYTTEEGVTEEGAEGTVEEPVFSDDAETVSGESAAAEGQDQVGHADDSVTRASEFESSHVSEFEFDDNDLPTF